MKFSQIDVINKEKILIANRKDLSNAKMFGRLFNYIIYPRNPFYTFNFYVPQYLFLRSVSFCDDIATEIEGSFTVADLANALFDDFLEYVKRKSDINDIYKRLSARMRTKTSIKPYSIDEAQPGVVFEEIRGFELISTRIEHKKALKAEFLLHDMLEIYPDHEFQLEDILEIIYTDFIDDYRKGLIKSPIDKIIQYVL